jgi:hypothetical protein
MWTLQQALDLVRSIQPTLVANGWFVALAGGVLNKGHSEHDLDLVLVPMKTGKTDLVELHCVLSGYLGTRTHEAEQMREHWKSKGSPDGKYVEVYRTDDGKRVDVVVAYPEGK